jgi:putative addiction module CopG family antidote
MDIEISPEVTSWIEQNLAAGRYRNHDDAIRRLLENGIEHEEEHQQALAEVDAKTQQGIDELDAGLGISQEDFEAHLALREAQWRAG